MTNERARHLIASLAVMAIVATACGDSASSVTTTTSPAEVTTTTEGAVASQTENEAPQFVGEFTIDPPGGVIGTVVTASGSGFDPGVDLTITWEDTTATWNVDLIEGKFFGREFTTEDVALATVTTGADGSFEFDFVVPEDFGFTHNVSVKSGDEVLNRAAFRTEMEMEISPTSGPVGTPITLTVRGMGYGYLENSWQLTYDNKYTGWVSAVTTDGSATAVIPAVGAPGTHIIQLTHGWSHVPYLNNQQSPRPDRPVFTFAFEVTDDPAVMPPPVAEQTMAPTVGVPPADDGSAAIWTDLRAAAVGSPLVLSGRNLPPDATLAFVWYRQQGSRVSGDGWSEVGVDLGTATTAADGTVSFAFDALDDLGGDHRIEAILGDEVLAETFFDVKPLGIEVVNASGPAGTMATFHVKGVGWTETANIYTLVYDNAYVGFACGFNSQGDIEIILPLTGEPGYHYVDLYPAIYRGEDIRGAVNFRLPQLTFADDHPGEDLPAFRFVVEVTED